MEDCIEIGTVKSLDGESARVSLQRTHDCGSCKACIFAGKGNIEILAHNPVGAKTGDRVRVDAKRNGLQSLIAILIGLGIPLVFFIVSISVCAAMDVEGWINLLISVGALILGFLLSFGIDRLLRRTRMAAKIVEILPVEEHITSDTGSNE